MLILVLATSIVALVFHAIYKWATLRNDFFAKRGVKYQTPHFLLGNTGGFFAFNRYSVPQFAQLLYNMFPTERISGIFHFRTPTFIVRDPETIKQMVIKDFDHFEDHAIFTDDNIDKFFGNILFNLKGQKWQDMRATLSKMRQMFELVLECADDMAEFFLKKAKNGEQIDIETKDLFARYTSDVIASCAFGIKVNSLADPDNEFYLFCKKILSLSGVSAALKIILMSNLPWLARLLGIEFLARDISRPFKSMILETMSTRQKEGIYRPDLINILLQVRQGKIVPRDEDSSKETEGYAIVQESDVGTKAVHRTWTDDEIVAQCFMFFLAGFDTSSTVINFAAYELAINPDVQMQLYAEIMETNANLNGKRLTYDALNKMKYLDQVMSETNRKWSPMGIIDRICVKNYTYDDGNLKFTIEKGNLLWILISGLHYDTKYFADPQKFDPERFSDENKRNIVAGSYIPFGIGPRNCIGSRFALMSMKAVLYYLLLNFSLEPNSNTPIPIELLKSPFGLGAKGGLSVELKPRH